MKLTLEKSKSAATSEEIDSVAQSIELYNLADLVEEFKSVQLMISSIKESALAAFFRSTFAQSMASFDASFNSE